MHTLKQHRFIGILCAFVLSLLPEIGFPLAFGQIKLHSYLNEPLYAEIELQDTEGIDTNHLIASLASVEDFKHIELARPYFLSTLRFEVVQQNKQVILKVTSEEAVKQPYLEFLVLLTWPEGRMVRDYTLLFDPAPFDAASKRALNEQALQMLNKTDLAENLDHAEPKQSFQDPEAILAIQAKSSKPEDLMPPTAVAETKNMLGMSDSSSNIMANKQKPAESIAATPVVSVPAVSAESLSMQSNITLSYKQILLGSGLVLLLAAALTGWFLRRARAGVRESFVNNLNNLNILEDAVVFDEEIKLKLDLAKQYIAYEDIENAEAILKEIINRGNGEEVKLAKKILQKIHR